MKNLFLLFLFAFLAKGTYSQHLGLYYSSNYLGTNLKVGYTLSKSRKTEKWTEFGVLFHFNKESYLDCRGYAYHKMGYAQKWGNHFGLFAKRSRPFYVNDYGLKLFGFSGLDYQYISTKNELYQSTGVKDSLGVITYYKYENINRNFHGLDLNLGLGCELKVSKKLLIVLEGGVSALIIYRHKTVTRTPSGSTILSARVPQFDFLGIISRVGIKYAIER